LAKIFQRSSINSVLVNIYLNELDLFVKKLKYKFDQKRVISVVPKFSSLSYFMSKERSAVSKLEIFRRVAKIRKLKIKSFIDVTFPKLVYARYLGEWLIGIRGSYSEALNLKDQLIMFLRKKLKLVFNFEKFITICSISTKILFLGIYIVKFQKRKYFNIKRIIDTGQVRLEAAIRLVVNYLTSMNFIRRRKPYPKFLWYHYSPTHIIIQYNRFLNSITEYYSFVDNRKVLMNYLYHLIKGSCSMLLAAKFRLKSQLKVYKKYGKNLMVDKIRKVQFYKPKY